MLYIVQVLEGDFTNNVVIIGILDEVVIWHGSHQAIKDVFLVVAVVERVELA